MNRVALTDGTNRWFNPDNTEKWEEETEWNGQNRISLATGSQWEHETLYRTKSGRWIVHHWSQWQGSTPSWKEITNNEAAQWLVRNGREPHEACEEEFAALEIS